jgi:hypothetical protein
VAPLELKSVLSMSYHPATPQLHCPPCVGSESFPSVPQKSSERDSPVYRKLRERQTQQGRQIDRETNLLSRRCLPTSKTILLSTFLTRVSSRVNVLKEHKLWYEDVKRQGQACQRSTKTKYEVHGDGGEKNILSRVL